MASSYKRKAKLNLSGVTTGRIINVAPEPKEVPVNVTLSPEAWRLLKDVIPDGLGLRRLLPFLTSVKRG